MAEAPRAIFRADASPKIGGGHVMRCLTLADELRRRGWTCAFATRPGAEETVPSLASSGHVVFHLSGEEQDEAREIEKGLGECALLVADHYGRDEKFETAARQFASRVFVIDDLADRAHDCDFLLDQTYGRQFSDYAGLVPGGAKLLMGTDYALLFI